MLSSSGTAYGEADGTRCCDGLSWTRACRTLRGAHIRECNGRLLRRDGRFVKQESRLRVTTMCPAVDEPEKARNLRSTPLRENMHASIRMPVSPIRCATPLECRHHEGLNRCAMRSRVRLRAAP